MTPRFFPIQRCWGRRDDGTMGYIENARRIPWDMIEPHEKQAMQNHGGQTLERLAQRGGLCACEALSVLGDRSWKKYEDHKIADIELTKLVDEYNQRKPGT